MAEPPSTAQTSAETVNWEELQDSPAFAHLRQALRSFIFPVTVAFLVWYFTYVLCAAFARDFMNIKVFGEFNIGLIFGLLQFVTTFLIALFYARHMNSKFDPEADKLRDEIEGVA
ncbi:DUF485 domain-containing protein [Nakamurella sp.]|uniref:DUF485 domain-containing protein n=1 Tax=Nakamurella sp. TaxID=1869182 RepID=UPI0037840225